MKVYAVVKSLHTPRLSFFHYLMFHGRQVAELPYRRLDHPCLGDDLSNPLYLIRNAQQVPEVFQVALNLIVVEEVKNKLAQLPHTTFLPVHFQKIVNFPIYPPGDRSFELSPAFQRVMGKANIERFLDQLPNVPSLHATLGRYYELVLPRLSDIAGKYPSVKTVICTMKTASERSEELTLSAELIRDFPVVWYGYTIFSELAFSLIAPHLDRDFFEVAELDV